MSVAGFKRGRECVWAFHLFQSDDVTVFVDRIHEWHTIQDHRVDQVSCIGMNVEDPCRMMRIWIASWENPSVGTRHNRDCVCVDGCGEGGGHGDVRHHVGVSPYSGEIP